jgi:hypothetical protein
MGQVRSGRIAQLKAVGGLGTCGCCFDDELLPEDQLIPIGGANISKFFRILPQKISMASDSGSELLRKLNWREICVNGWLGMI